MQFNRLTDTSSSDDWSTEVSCIQDGIHVSRTLIPPNSWSDIPVRVMNVKNQPAIIESGTVMAAAGQPSQCQTQ